LITGILCDSRGSRHYFRDFYARRVLRILPIYYGFLLIVFLVLPRLPSLGTWDTPDFSTQSWFWFHLSNFLVAFRGWDASPQLVPHFWSLAVEEQFYLVWPTLVFFASRRTLLRVCAACVVLSLLVRVGLRHTALPWYAGIVFTPARLDALALGATVAVLLRAPQSALLVKRWAGHAALVTGCMFVGIFSWRHFANAEDRVIGTVGMSAFDWFAASLVALAASGNASRAPLKWLCFPWLRTIGRYSYGMYVIHVLVLKLVNDSGYSIADLRQRLGSTLAAHAVNVCVNLGLTVALAALSFHLIEKRFLALKERFGNGPATSANPNAPVDGHPARPRNP
jgi:peptidoglycan/LPS O-acetylase OafA/YrhL